MWPVWGIEELSVTCVDRKQQIKLQWRSEGRRRERIRANQTGSERSAWQTAGGGVPRWWRHPATPDLLLWSPRQQRLKGAPVRPVAIASSAWRPLGYQTVLLPGHGKPQWFLCGCHVTLWWWCHIVLKRRHLDRRIIFKFSTEIQTWGRRNSSVCF